MRSRYGKNAFAQLLWMINQRPRSYVEQTKRNILNGSNNLRDEDCSWRLFWCVRCVLMCYMQLTFQGFVLPIPHWREIEKRFRWDRSLREEIRTALGASYLEKASSRPSSVSWNEEQNGSWILRRQVKIIVGSHSCGILPVRLIWEKNHVHKRTRSYP